MESSIAMATRSTTTGDISTSMVLITSGASGRVNAFLSLRALKSLVMLINAFLLLLIFPFQGRIWKRCISTASTEKQNKDDHYQNQQEIIIIPGRKGAAPPVLRVSSRKSNSSAVAVKSADQDGALTRRTLAIRRATQDEDDEEKLQSVTEVHLFATSRGETLFTQSWTPPVSIKIKGLVVLLHGLNEHSGRYRNFAKQLNANGYKVYGMDWIGHGGSDGLHAYVHSLDDAVTDLKAFFEKVLADNPGIPCFCFGHSTGAAIVLKAVMDRNIETLINGVVLTSPAVKVQPSHPIVGVLAPVFSFLLPKYQFSAANKKGMPVSRDPDALIAKYSDPLVYTGSIRVRTGYEILRISYYLQKNLNRLTVPFLVLHGTADTVTEPQASEKLYEEASSTDKSIKLYEGYLHDLLFEPERESIAKEIIDWLNYRIKT